MKKREEEEARVAAAAAAAELEKQREQEVEALKTSKQQQPTEKSSETTTSIKVTAGGAESKKIPLPASPRKQAAGAAAQRFDASKDPNAAHGERAETDRRDRRSTAGSVAAAARSTAATERSAARVRASAERNQSAVAPRGAPRRSPTHVVARDRCAAGVAESLIRARAAWV